MKLVLKLMEENPSRGSDRIVGVLANLHVQISDSTVDNIRKRNGIPSAPQRVKQTAWCQFLRAHWEGLIAPRSPWSNPFVERLIGSIRRECLDRVIIFHERQLKQILQSYCEYYHKVRPHRSLSHDSPIAQPVESPERGKGIEMPRVGGLHHQYLRQAA